MPPLRLADYFPEMQGFTPVDTSARLPAIPNAETQQSPYLSTTLPLAMTYSGDSVKQYLKPGLSSFRISPLAPNASPAVNAAAATVAKTIIKNTVVTNPGVTSF